MTVTPDQSSNFGTSTIAYGAGGPGTALGATDTSVTLHSGDGALFPARAPFNVLLGSINGAHEIAKCSAISTDTLTLVRAQEGTTGALWGIGTSIQQVTTAANLLNLWTASPQVYNVMGFGARCDGATDDTSAILAAYSAASGGGGQVFIPGASVISNTIAINAENVQLIGSGRGSALIAKAGFPTAPMVWYEAPATGFRHGCVIRDLLIQNTVNSAATGIQLDSTYYATIERVDVEGIYANNIYLNGSSSYFGAYTRIRDCHLGPTVGGGGSSGIGVLSHNHEHWTVESCTINWFNGAGGCGIKVTSSACSIINNDFDDCDTCVWLYFCALPRVLGNNFDRGLTRFLYINGATGARVQGNDFDTFVGTGSQDALYLDNVAADNLIYGNVWQTSTTWVNAIHDNANSGKVNYYANNDLGGLAVVKGQGVYRANVGYNPRGHNVAQPAVPASGVAYTNTTETDVTIFVTGGTVSAIAIGGTNTGLTSGAFRVPYGQTIAVTYSVAPTWSWFGD